VTTPAGGPEPGGPEYVDHPAPSPVFLAFLVVMMGTLVWAMVMMLRTPGALAQTDALVPLAVMGLSLLCLGFYFWPLFATYYALSPAGLLVHYGPWVRRYPWSDFKTARHRRGLFAQRIGWPSVTPCVRLTNGIRLERQRGWRHLYLTPRDPEAFLMRLSQFAPTLTSGSPS